MAKKEDNTQSLIVIVLLVLMGLVAVIAIPRLTNRQALNTPSRADEVFLKDDVTVSNENETVGFEYNPKFDLSHFANSSACLKSIDFGFQVGQPIPIPTEDPQGFCSASIECMNTITKDLTKMDQPYFPLRCVRDRQNPRKARCDAISDSEFAICPRKDVWIRWVVYSLCGECISPIPLTPVPTEGDIFLPTPISNPE